MFVHPNSSNYATPLLLLALLVVLSSFTPALALLSLTGSSNSLYSTGVGSTSYRGFAASSARAKARIEITTASLKTHPSYDSQYMFPPEFSIPVENQGLVVFRPEWTTTPTETSPNADWVVEFGWDIYRPASGPEFQWSWERRIFNGCEFTLTVWEGDSLVDEPATIAGFYPSLLAFGQSHTFPSLNPVYTYDLTNSKAELYFTDLYDTPFSSNWVFLFRALNQVSLIGTTPCALLTDYSPSGLTIDCVHFAPPPAANSFIRVSFSSAEPVTSTSIAFSIAVKVDITTLPVYLSLVTVSTIDKLPVLVNVNQLQSTYISTYQRPDNQLPIYTSPAFRLIAIEPSTAVFKKNGYRWVFRLLPGSDAVDQFTMYPQTIFPGESMIDFCTFEQADYDQGYVKVLQVKVGSLLSQGFNRAKVDADPPTEAFKVTCHGAVAPFMAHREAYQESGFTWTAAALDSPWATRISFSNYGLLSFDRSEILPSPQTIAPITTTAAPYSKEIAISSTSTTASATMIIDYPGWVPRLSLGLEVSTPIDVLLSGSRLQYTADLFTLKGSERVLTTTALQYSDACTLTQNVSQNVYLCPFWRIWEHYNLKIYITTLFPLSTPPSTHHKITAKFSNYLPGSTAFVAQNLAPIPLPNSAIPALPTFTLAPVIFTSFTATQALTIQPTTKLQAFNLLESMPATKPEQSTLIIPNLSTSTFSFTVTSYTPERQDYYQITYYYFRQSTSNPSEVQADPSFLFQTAILPIAGATTTTPPLNTFIPNIASPHVFFVVAYFEGQNTTPTMYAHSPQFQILPPCFDFQGTTAAEAGMSAKWASKCNNGGVCDFSGQCSCKDSFGGSTCADAPCAQCLSANIESCTTSAPGLFDNQPGAVPGGKCECDAESWEGDQCDQPLGCATLSTKQCKNGGYLDQLDASSAACDVTKDCNCIGRWSGKDCATCSIAGSNCKNGGRMSSKCSCGCAIGFTGTYCQCGGHAMSFTLPAENQAVIDYYAAEALTDAEALRNRDQDYGVVEFYVRMVLSDLLGITTSSITALAIRSSQQAFRTPISFNVFSNCDEFNPGLTPKALETAFKAAASSTFAQHTTIQKLFKFAPTPPTLPDPTFVPFPETLEPQTPTPPEPEPDDVVDDENGASPFLILPTNLYILSTLYFLLLSSLFLV